MNEQLEGEVLAEEDAGPRAATDPVRHLPLPAERREAALPVLREEVRTAALAAAGGVLAGAATVAAVRAVSAAGARSRPRLPRRGGRRRERVNVLTSRSFLVDVHLLDR
ncbi:MAG TPA: hypothetical protein VFJ99_05305 [Solirubrobacterales bacterium]|nr:hypothetical protein [Solirubrobacterales bacterium]